MNKTAIKNFAVWARTKLRDDIKIRAGFLGINEDGVATPLPASTPEIKYFEVGSAQPIALSGETLRKRERIVDKLQKKASETDYKTAYDLMIETYASDWFNRFVALRFMEVNERFSDNMRVLSSSNPDRHDPDIVSQPFSSDLEFTDAERADVTEWKAKNETDKLFRFLLIKRCNQLSNVLPGLFEAKGDESELMMRQSFIDKDGMIYRLVNDIDEEDWKDQVQIIGWLYQYYNSELKDETFALAKDEKKITKERVPSATQLFTPDWIVRYMVENSLGRLWIEGHVAGKWSEEAENKAADEFGWKYYLPEAKQEPDVASKFEDLRKEYSKLNPEDLTFIDPSMGSGHILVYAFDVLMQIYESLGYTKRDAARSIVENNIYGLDIDDRAYQLAYFAVMMKACEYDGRFLERGVSPHVYSIQESNDVKRSQLKFFGATLSDIEKNNAINQMIGLLDTFIDSKEYGSVLNVENYDWDLLQKFTSAIDEAGQISIETVGITETRDSLRQLIEIGKAMAKKYWVTCTNPPYMGDRNMDAKLSTFLKEHYDFGKADLSTVFIQKGISLTVSNGFMAMVTPQSWMFLVTFNNLRNELLSTVSVSSLLQFGSGAFDAGFGTAAFVVKKIIESHSRGVFIDLREGKDEFEKQKMIFEKTNYYYTKNETMLLLPNTIMAYWCSEAMQKLFSDKGQVRDYFESECGIKNGSNVLFLRAWFEVSYDKVNSTDNRSECLDNMASGKKWFKCNKGGGFKKWYGNFEYVLDLENNARNIRNTIPPSTYRLRKQENYFWPTITWPLSGGNKFGCRYMHTDVLPDVNANIIIIKNKMANCLMGYMNTKVFSQLLDMLNPTVNFPKDTIDSAPYIEVDDDRINELVEENIRLSKKDWDSFENSWDFICHPLVRIALDSHKSEKISKVEKAFEQWERECEVRFNTIKANEEELNRIFIDIYGLQEELCPEEDESDVTVCKADITRDIKGLVSYAVGCILGRYSLDDGGLAYAGGVWDDSKYSSFQPDSDNVIPITDARYMDDDIVDRFCDWLMVVYGEESLEDNLSFIANALGTKGTDSRDIIRNYFMNDFFKDHCQTYSVTGSGKRPIYWLFDSGKQNGFKALVYMHRYNADTIGRVRVSYLHPLQEKYENEVRTIDTMIQSMTNQRQISAEEKRREKLIKQIAEVKEYDERLDHLAQEHIDIDLDDGVKVNYEKIQTDSDGKKYQILAPIK